MHLFEIHLTHFITTMVRGLNTSPRSSDNFHVRRFLTETDNGRGLAARRRELTQQLNQVNQM